MGRVLAGFAAVRAAVAAAGSRVCRLILRDLIFRDSKAVSGLRRVGRLRGLAGSRTCFPGCLAGVGDRLVGRNLGRIWNIKWRLISGLRFAGV